MENRKPKKYIQIKLYEEHSELIKFLSHHKTESIIFMMQFFQKMYEKSDAKTLFDLTDASLKILENYSNRMTNTSGEKTEITSDLSVES